MGSQGERAAASTRRFWEAGALRGVWGGRVCKVLHSDAVNGTIVTVLGGFWGDLTLQDLMLRRNQLYAGATLGGQAVGVFRPPGQGPGFGRGGEQAEEDSQWKGVALTQTVFWRRLDSPVTWVCRVREREDLAALLRVLVKGAAPASAMPPARRP